MYIALNYFRTT